MPFDSLSIMALCRELDQDFQNARIDKIHQPERDELVFSIRTYDQGNVRLVISANSRWARMHLDPSRRANPTRPPAFCMLLRKYLEGGKIKSVRQLGLERIVHFQIEAVNELGDWKERILVCEFMGKHSNIMLLNPENNQIIDAIKRYGSELSSHRQVFPGQEYIAPPPQRKLDPLQSGYEDFARAFWQHDGAEASQALLLTFLGLSPFASRQVCLRAGLDPSLDTSQCGELELSRLYEQSRLLFNSIIQDEYHPFIIYRRGRPVDFAPYEAQCQSGEKLEPMASMNETLARFYSEQMASIRMESSRAELRKKMGERLDKVHKKYLAQQGDLHRAMENRRYRLWGELLVTYASHYQKGDRTAILENYENGEILEIPLDPRFTPIQNAQRYYKTYNKSVSTERHLKDLMDNNLAELAYLESVLLEIEEAESPEELAEITDELEKEALLSPRSGSKGSAKPRSRPRLFISSEGLNILVGRNNRQNDHLTMREAGRNDLWMHSRQMAGAHVILQLPPTVKSINDVPDKSLEEAAALAAHFSRGRESSKVEVDYTFRHQVQKPPGAKPGMVIYQQYWTIIAQPAGPKLLDREKPAINPEPS